MLILLIVLSIVYLLLEGAPNMDRLNTSTNEPFNTAKLKVVSNLKSHEEGISEKSNLNNTKSTTVASTDLSNQSVLKADKVSISTEAKSKNLTEINVDQPKSTEVNQEEVADNETLNEEERQVKEDGVEETKSDTTQTEAEALDEQIRELQQKILDLSTRIALLEAKRELQLSGDENSAGSSELDKEIDSLKIDLAIAEGILKVTIERKLSISKVEHMQ